MFELLTIALFVFVSYFAGMAITALARFALNQALKRREAERKANLIKRMDAAVARLDAVCGELDFMTGRK